MIYRELYQVLKDLLQGNHHVLLLIRAFFFLFSSGMINLLKSVDLPTFGRPTRATSGFVELVSEVEGAIFSLVACLVYCSHQNGDSTRKDTESSSVFTTVDCTSRFNWVKFINAKPTLNSLEEIVPACCRVSVNSGVCRSGNPLVFECVINEGNRESPSSVLVTR